jgi:redox-sensitive bicupin YhaK (pirin superfamily)
MIYVRRGEERGRFDHGWLDTRHSFSFGSYRDPKFMGFRSLRVINEDFVAPGQGFGTHPHRDMEIFTYVLSGALEHRDSLGSGAVLRPGEFQYMSAGSGIEHSEFNPSNDEQVHLYQIWVLPNERSAAPRYDQLNVSDAEKRNRLKTVASPDGRDGSLAIRQDATIGLSQLEAGQSLVVPIADGRHVWLQILSGEFAVNGEAVQAGDGAAVSEENELRIEGRQTGEFLLFDMA